MAALLILKHIGKVRCVTCRAWTALYATTTDGRVCVGCYVSESSTHE